MVWVAMVVEHTDHSPGTTGARLMAALGDDGSLRVEGTIGGGVMEHRMLARAADCLRQERFVAEVVHLQHAPKATGGAAASGMICAGRQRNLYYLCRPDRELAAVRQLLESVEAQERPSPDAPPTVAVLEISSGGWRVLRRPPNFSRPAHQLEVDTDGGFVYREELLARRRVALFGGGHCAVAVARLVRRLEFDVVAFEGPKKRPEPELQEHAHRLESVTDFRDAAARVPYPEITYGVVLTSDADSDVRALDGALRRPFPFLGVMGSPAKIHYIRQRLLAEGWSNDDLKRLTAPVGLPLASRTPDEIAVSIAAQLLRFQAEPGAGLDASS